MGAAKMPIGQVAMIVRRAGDRENAVRAEHEIATVNAGFGGESLGSNLGSNVPCEDPHAACRDARDSRIAWLSDRIR
jgi:hypothetical protein